jgi:hypothetical protein
MEGHRPFAVVTLDDLVGDSRDQRLLLAVLQRARKTGAPLGPRTLDFLIRYFSRPRKTRAPGRPPEDERLTWAKRYDRPIDPVAVAAFFAEQARDELRRTFGSKHRVESADGRSGPILEVAAALGVARLVHEGCGKYRRTDRIQVYRLLRRPVARRQHLPDEYAKFREFQIRAKK